MTAAASAPSAAATIASCMRRDASPATNSPATTASVVVVVPEVVVDDGISATLESVPRTSGAVVFSPKPSVVVELASSIAAAGTDDKGSPPTRMVVDKGGVVVAGPGSCVVGTSWGRNSNCSRLHPDDERRQAHSSRK